MSTISISQNHAKSEDDVREMLESLAEKLKHEYDVTAQWLSDRELELKRSGIEGRLTMLSGEVKVDLRLGMLMSPFKSKIRDELSRAMAEKLA